MYIDLKTRTGNNGHGIIIKTLVYFLLLTLIRQYYCTYVLHNRLACTECQINVLLITTTSL